LVPPAASPSIRAVEPSASYLLARLGIVESRVRALIAHRRDDDPSPDDPFRGLYLSDEHIDQVLAGGSAAQVIDWEEGGRLESLEAEAARVEAEGVPIRLRDVARKAGLGTLDVDLLLVALAPDLDARFERLYGYLNDDVTRRRASVLLGLELAGTSPWSAAARARLSAESPLVSNGIVVVEETDRPYLSRSLRVPDRVAAHLLGDDEADPAVAGLLSTAASLAPSTLSESLAQVVLGGVGLAYLREAPGSSAPALAVTALSEAGIPAVCVDLGQLASSDEPEVMGRLARREALLRGAALVAGPLEVLVDRGPDSVRSFTSLAGEPGQEAVLGSWVVPVILHGKAGWEPSWSARVPAVLEVAREPGPGASPAGNSISATTRPRGWSSPTSPASSVSRRSRWQGRWRQPGCKQQSTARRSASTICGPVPGRRTARVSNVWPAGSVPPSVGET
jgi:hypothetical protein